MPFPFPITSAPNSTWARITTALASMVIGFEGVSTHFNGVGTPYGACGVPDEVAYAEGAIDSLSGQGNPFDYVALNVFDTPGNYASPGDMGKRPLRGADTVKMGTYRNGQNCGRWVKVTFGNECDGVNDGAQDQPFCRGGKGWFADDHTGGSIHAIVFDQCSDGNAWCRDSKYHLDLHTPILNRLRKNGQLLSPLAVPTSKTDPNNPLAREFQVTGFNNRQISWEFVPAPAYHGEPRFYFSEASKIYYMRVIVTHLPNGIHSLQQWDGTSWKDATMEGDAGQMWVLPVSDRNSMKLRIVDADDQLVMGGRNWSMDYPKACGTLCSKPATPADNLVGTGGDTALSSLAPKIASNPARIRHSGQDLIVPGFGDGWMELRSLAGQRSRRSIHAGRASRSGLPSGVWAIHWTSGGRQGKAILALP